MINIYWIYDADTMTDPLTEGYIGASRKSAQQRLKFHMTHKLSGVPGTTSSAKRHLCDEIAKMSNPQARTICRLDNEEDASLVEFLLRPEMNIGLNRYRGGKKNGVQRPIYVILEDGTRIDYTSQANAARDGFAQGAVSGNLNGRSKSVIGTKHGRGCFYYATP